MMMRQTVTGTWTRLRECEWRMFLLDEDVNLELDLMMLDSESMFGSKVTALDWCWLWWWCCCWRGSVLLYVLWWCLPNVAVVVNPAAVNSFSKSWTQTWWWSKAALAADKTAASLTQNSQDPQGCPEWVGSLLRSIIPGVETTCPLRQRKTHTHKK